MADLIKLIISFSLVFCSQTVLAEQDPTAPLNWNAPEPETVKKTKRKPKLPSLQSIICREEDKCYAILSNKIANVNDVVSGYRVKTVNMKEVILVRGNASYKLTLFTSDIKN